MQATVRDRYGCFDVSVETPMGKELLKWEKKHPSPQPFPVMMYKAYKGDDGRIRCMDTDPHPSFFANAEMYRMACDKVAHFNVSCTRVVQDDIEMKQARSEGWRESPQEALDAQWGWEKEMGQAAAERAFADRNMSEKAKEEAKVFEASTPNIIASIPEAPTVKKPHHMSKEARAARAAANA